MRLVVAALLVAGLSRSALADPPEFDGRKLYRVGADGPALGPADAPVTIVEFSDFLCRYCQKAAETLEDVRLLYGDRVRVVYRHSLLDPEDGTLPAEAALAADAQGRFWPFHDRLFAADRPLGRAALEAYAGEIGLDLARFRRELDGGHHRARLRAELAEAAALGVTSTPMFFVNGRPLSGAQPLGVFARVIEGELARAEATRAAGVAPARLYQQLTAGGLAAAGPPDDDAIELGAAPLDPDGRYPVGVGLPMQRRGRDDALVTVVEFGDFLCGFCARVQPTLSALRAKYGADVRFVSRFFPFADHPASRQLAYTAFAAGEQGQYWGLHDGLFGAGRIDGGALARVVADLGLDVDRMRAGLADGRYRRMFAADHAEASGHGVRGTPTFFINGRPLVGAQPQASFEKLIDAELARARALVQRGAPRAEIYRRALQPD